jgi:hypothetical protein
MRVHKALDAEHQAEMLAADPDLQGINSKKHLQSVVHSKEPQKQPLLIYPDRMCGHRSTSP